MHGLRAERLGLQKAALGLMPSTPVLLLQLGPAHPLKVYKCASKALAKFLSLLGAFPLVLSGSSLVDCFLLPSWELAPLLLPERVAPKVCIQPWWLLPQIIHAPGTSGVWVSLSPPAA